VSNLGQIIRDIQRQAAALPIDTLRDEIEINLEVQDAAICQFLSIRPGAGRTEELIVATGAVWISMLTTALYVRELTARPVNHVAAVTFSPN
jgi:hypothetical protein